MYISTPGGDCYADADALMLKIRAGIFVSGRADKHYFLLGLLVLDDRRLH